MATFLLDTNVLIAIGWINHIHAMKARAWMASLRSDKWATCPMTECGFVRISCNPKALPQATTAQGAIDMLRQMRNGPGHVFVNDSISIVDSTLISPAIRGHQQITDAYLFSLCIKHDMRLVTFDQGVLSLASADAERSHIHILQ